MPVAEVDTGQVDPFAYSLEAAVDQIDVEGAEYGVLNGAPLTLRRGIAPMWLLEVCLHEFHPAGFNPDFLRVFQLFWENGYEAYTAEAKPRLVPRERVQTWWSDRRTDSGSFNYIFCDADGARGVTAR